MTPTPKAVLNNQANFALGKYEALLFDDKSMIDKNVDKLHAHFSSKGFHPEPSLAYKLELLMIVGTWMNENGR